jgi:hypothetical protein
MKVVRWPECDILESELKVIDEFWYKTNVGPISTGFIFPLSELETLQSIKSRIQAKRKELSDIESEIYRVSRIFNR